MSSIKCLLTCVFIILGCLDGFAQRAAQDADTDVKNDIKNTGDSSQKAKLNTDTIYVMTGAYTGTYLRIGADISAVMDGKNGLRVLPILTAGSVKNMKDILYLNGIDVGIIQADVLGYLESEEGLSNLKERVSYISKLYNEEAHLISLKSVKNIKELQGKKVNCGKAGSGTYVTCVTVFRKLDINVSISDQDDITAFGKLKSGEIDAIFFVAGKPAEFGKQIPSGNYHFLPIPYEDSLQGVYLPSSLSSLTRSGSHEPSPQVSERSRSHRSGHPSSHAMSKARHLISSRKIHKPRAF